MTACAHRLGVAAWLVLGACGGAASTAPGVTPTGNAGAGAAEVGPAPDPLRAWIDAPTSPDGTVLLGAVGEDLTCTDIATTHSHGPTAMWEAGALLMTGASIDSYQDGLWTWYHRNRVVSAQGMWRHGRKVGEWRAWDDHGHLLSTWDMGADGTGTNELWRAGRLIAAQAYVDGCPQGRWVQFDGDGGVLAETTMNHGAGVALERDPATKQVRFRRGRSGRRARRFRRDPAPAGG